MTTKHGYSVSTTPDHKFLSTDGYVELQALKPGDRLLLQSGEGAWSKNYRLPNVEAIQEAMATMAQGGDRASGSLTTRRDFAALYANLPTDWSHDLGMVMGWLVGDGWLSEKSGSPLGMVFGAEKDEAKDIIHEAMSQWFGEGHLHDRGELQRLTYGQLPFKFFSALGVGAVRAPEKRVPEWVWSAPREAVIGFLQGLFTADGTVSLMTSKGSCSIRLASSSQGLLEDVQLLLLNLGIVSKIHLRRNAGYRSMPDGKGGHKAYLAHADYELLIDKVNRDRFLDSVGFLDSKKQNKAQDFVTAKVRRSNAETFETSIAAIEDAGIANVYDLTEMQTHSLIANGVVAHNCGEQWLGPFENCCLGSINLAKLAVNDGVLDWAELQRQTTLATRFLDDVVSANNYVPAVPQLAEAAHRVRRIGLGIMGLSDLMYRLGVRYGSEEGQEFAGQILEFVRWHCMTASIDLAEERGAFPAIKGSIYDPEDLKWTPPTPLFPFSRDWQRPALDWSKITAGSKQHRLRNRPQMTIPPAGTIRPDSGLESYRFETRLGLSYIRHVNDRGTDLQLQYTSPLFEAALQKSGLTAEQIEAIVKEVNLQGTCQNIADLPESIRHTFVVSADVSADEHIRMQAAMQAFVDNSLSKTCNFPAGATVEDVEKAYILGWKLGCKGLTVYVTGSRDKVVLETHATAKAKEEPQTVAVVQEAIPVPLPLFMEPKKPRPSRLEGRPYRIGTPAGTTFVTVNENGEGKGQPFELFIHSSKAGSETAAVSEAIGRLASLILRITSPVKPRERLKELVHQLDGIGGGRSTGVGAGGRRSLPDGVAQVVPEDLEETFYEPKSF